MKHIQIVLSLMLLFLFYQKSYAQFDEINIAAGESKTIRSGEVIKKVSIGDPKVADVKVLSNTEILVNGKQEGSTSLIIWTSATTLTKKIIVSSVNADVVRQELSSLLQGVKGVTLSIKAGKVVLDGEVTDQKDVTIVDNVLKRYGDKIMNFVKLPFQMIKINARVVEIGESSDSSLGVNWQKKFEFVEGSIKGLYQIGQMTRATKVDAILDFMVQEGKAKVVARPNIIVINGESASFHSGGRILVPVGKDMNNVSIDEKSYGVNLKVLPYGDRKSNLIKTKVEIEVSTLDWKNGVTTANGTVPAIRDRKIETQIDIKLGRTIVIGGLLTEEESILEDKVPILGYIPLLGLLFSSRQKVIYKTELVIFLTPSFVNFFGEEIVE
ncbi:MAG: pilus assembly protein N-terminal domain-containing protein [bacterium]|nr:pilus assembly protein N-terminal domain-containing protein [bacterium]